MEIKSWGNRDSKGEWQPDALPEPGALFQWPLKPVKIIKFLFGPGGLYIPYNLIYALMAVISWMYFTPDLSRAETFHFSWILEIYIRNAVLLILVAGGLHLRLYIQKAQGENYKYTSKWLSKSSSKFLFNHQTWDNIFWSLTSGCIIWTLYEALTLWMFANSKIPFLDFKAHPIAFILMMMAIPLLRYFHFYWIHRFSHWNPIYKSSHYLHHKNINVGPWSGLSMHPIEHILYFSGVIIHWIIPSHPMHAIFHLLHAGISPALGHTGFHKLLKNTESDKGIMADSYFHFLHHKFFTVNFGVEAFPLDKWFGSFHNGTPEAQAAMMEKRRKAKK